MSRARDAGCHRDADHRCGAGGLCPRRSVPIIAIAGALAIGGVAYALRTRIDHSMREDAVRDARRTFCGYGPTVLGAENGEDALRMARELGWSGRPGPPGAATVCAGGVGRGGARSAGCAARRALAGLRGTGGLRRGIEKGGSHGVRESPTSGRSPSSGLSPVERRRRTGKRGVARWNEVTSAAA